MRQNTVPTQMTLTHEDVEFVREQAEYFDTHDMSEELANGPEVHFEISPSATSHYYFEIEPELRAKLKAIAEQRSMKAETLLNEWVREKAAESQAVGAVN